MTITNDIDSADLPLEIPDNVGHVTLDLNGHDLVGGDGRDGARPSQDAGEDGKPAIVIVPGTGDGDATRLSLVTTGGDSLVKGGDGGAGNPGGNMRGGASALIANARTGARLAAGAAFRTGSDALAGVVPGLLVDLLPDGQEVRMKGAAFDIDKAGKAKLLKDKSGIDQSGLGPNPSGLKLKYTMKNGTFKGTFSAYALDGGKLKKVKVAVSGVVLGGKGYGTASVKKPAASWPVEIR